jgi:hypothetical protein
MIQSDGSQPGEYTIHDFDRVSGIECNYPVVVYGPEEIKGVPVSLIEVRLPQWHPASAGEDEVLYVVARPATDEEEQSEENDFLEWLNGLRLCRHGVESSMKFVKKEGADVWPATLSDARVRLQEMAHHADEYPALFGFEGVIGFEFPTLDFVLCRTCAIDTYPETLKEAIEEAMGTPVRESIFAAAKQFAVYATDPAAHLLNCHLFGCEKALVGSSPVDEVGSQEEK